MEVRAISNYFWKENTYYFRYSLFELEGAPENVKKILEKVPNANIEYIPLNKESNALANAYLDEGVVSENVHEILRIACTKK